jgi:hypothetical protein
MKYLVSQTSYGAHGSFFFWCHLSSHTTQTETMELEVHRVHWQPTTPPGFSMVNKVNLLHPWNQIFLKLQNTTDLFYRLKSILVTFLVIDVSLVKSIYDKALFTKLLNMFSISPCNSQVPSDLACEDRSLV